MKPLWATQVLIWKPSHGCQKKTAEILDCSQDLLESLHELLGRIESLKFQDPRVLKNLSERVFNLYQTDFGQFSKMNPSFHRAIAHSEEFAQYYQSEGFTIGEMSETAQEAINCPTKKDVAFFSYRGSHKSQNLQCFQRNWAFADPFTLEFAEWKNKNSFLLTHVDMLPDHMIQGVFFNWRSPKINKYGEKLKYQNWCPQNVINFAGTWYWIFLLLIMEDIMFQ